MTEWSAQQEEALERIDRWFRAGEEQCFYLAGYAGVGKTTLAREIAQRVPGRVEFAAFTGKAAYVLQSKGCSGARTIHSLIYQTRDKGRGRLRQLQRELEKLAELPEDHPQLRELRRLIRAEEEALKQPFFVLNPESDLCGASLLIVDEVSMLGSHVGADLLSFGTPVLVLGDPAQLPPVGDAGYFTAREPGYLLTEIHRQAKGNPIIKLATAVREGRGLSRGCHGESAVIGRGQLDSETALRADQILVGRNKTRFAINRRVRQLLGRRTQLPEPGDRVVCLRNDYEHELLNGAIWEVEAVHDLDPEHSMRGVLELTDGGARRLQCEAHLHHFLGRGRELPWWERREAQEFDYGYALTTHKAQGSQWDDVLVLDESRAFRADARAWLYTAVTRAAERVTVVENY